MKHAIAAVALAIASCPSWAGTWDSPGVGRFSGNIPRAVHDYKDIPKATRDALQARMERHDYDDQVTITRDAITGLWGHVYLPKITEMHGGSRGRIMPEATRDGWADGFEVGALVYHEGGFTIIVPAVCGNVARVTRLPATPDTPDTPAAETGGGGSRAAPTGYIPSYAVPRVALVAPEPGIVIPMLPPPWILPGPCCGVPLPAVPEPAAWMLLLAGLGLVPILTVALKRNTIRHTATRPHSSTSIVTI